MQIARIGLATMVFYACVAAGPRQKPARAVPIRAEPRVSNFIGPGITRQPCFVSIRCWPAIRRDLEILIKRGVCYLTLDKPEKALADFDRVNRHSTWSSRVFGANGTTTPTPRGCRSGRLTPTSPKAGATAASLS